MGSARTNQLVQHTIRTRSMRAVPIVTSGFTGHVPVRSSSVDGDGPTKSEACMKGNGQNSFRPSLWLAVVCLLLVTTVARAQQPSPSPTPKQPDDASGAPVEAGEDAGKYSIITSVEFGYRGLQVVGDQNKYESDLNYRAGPRLFDSSFLMRSKEGDGGLFDQLLFTATGWGGDPSGTMRFSVEKPK